MATITKTLTIESQGTYNLTFDLWSYSEWAASAGITTSYASLAALIADEKAVRQLMTVHASVDYFANCPDSTIISTIINNDLCAKWINLSDYALDTLSANSDIKSVMDTADKYGYGEWGKINSTTWGPLGNVPVMTSNTAPYGEVTASSSWGGYPAYYAFDNNSSTAWSCSRDDSWGNAYIEYDFVNPVCVKSVRMVTESTTHDVNLVKTYQLKGCNGSTWENVGGVADRGAANVVETNIAVENTKFYSKYRVVLLSGYAIGSVVISKLQFYGRELTPLVPTMVSNTTPRGEASASSIYDSSYPAWKAFDGIRGNNSDAWTSSGSSSLQWIQYKFEKPKCVQFIDIEPAYGSDGGTYRNAVKQFKIIASNDNFVNDIHEVLALQTLSNINVGLKHYKLNNNEAYMYYRISDIDTYFSDNTKAIRYLQFYSFNYSEKEFAPGSTRKTIYDHGVEPSGAITGGTKNPDCLTLSAIGTATVTIDKGTRTYIGGKAGLHASGTNRLKCGSGYSAFTASNMPDSNGFDISSISGSVAVGIEQTARGTFDCTEIWIE